MKTERLRALALAPSGGADFVSVVHPAVREAAAHLGVSRLVVHRWGLSQEGAENKPSMAKMIR
jgi:hypothetical protein